MECQSYNMEYTMKSDVQVAVIGGGIVGASVLYWLAKMGWTDSVLVERRDLTSGSTWHAAGNVTYQLGHNYDRIS